MSDAIWRDSPLRTGAEDALGRQTYAQRAAELIANVHSFESSAVFGLSGPWGSGKTSLINMVVDELTSKNQAWSISWFTPWATSDVSGLISEFYSSLSAALPRKKSKQLRKALALTASIVAPALDSVPWAGKALSTGTSKIAERLAKVPSWQDAFDKASSEFRKLDRPILIVVDDIDRLHADELLILLKVVRLLGRFNGVQYLLAYDDESMHRNLAASGALSGDEGTAQRFMEKIVQYPLFVPPMTRYQQLARINAGLASVSRTQADDQYSSHRLNSLADCFVELLPTPRAIDRYIAQLKHHIPLLPFDEIDDDDVLLLTLLRVATPALFAAIPRFRDELLSGHSGAFKSISQTGFELEPFDIMPLLNQVPVKQKEPAERLLKALFPNLKGGASVSSYESLSRQSVQHSAYFDRYFVMGILENDVSDVVVRDAVMAASNAEPTRLNDLLLRESEEFRQLAIGKARVSDNQPSSDSGRRNLAKVLIGTVKDQSEVHGILSSSRDQTFRWIAELLNALSGGNADFFRIEIMKEFGNLSDQIHVWEMLHEVVRSAVEGMDSRAFEKLTDDLADRVTIRCIEHIGEGDSAELDLDIGYQLRFVLRQRPDPLKNKVQELLETKRVTLATIASRFVSTVKFSGPGENWQLSEDFDQEFFDLLVPSTDDPWYHLERVDVNRGDLSWSNRAKFAAGRVDRPPAD